MNQLQMDPSIQLIFALLIVFQIKHFIADFPLQREYMLRKSLPGWAFVIPLSIHCTVHATLTLSICFFVNSSLWWLALVDFVVHFLMDRIKSGPQFLGRFNDLSKPGFWNCLGFDQMIHHLTHIWIVYALVFY